MGSYKEITGDLFVEMFKGEFDVIAQGCNAFCTQGAGIVIPFKKHFKTDKFPMELKGKGDINKLGQIDWELFTVVDGVVHNWLPPDNTKGFDLYVINCYSQYHYGRNHADGDKIPIDYEALTLCMRKINHKFKGCKVGLPFIGAGLAGGDPDTIREIFKTELKDCDVTLVIFEK